MFTIENQHKREILPKIALLGAAAIWGSSFFIMKNTVDVFPPYFLLAVRFTIACIFLVIVFWKKVKNITVDYLWKSAIIGLFLFLAYTTQTIGITATTPGKNAFLTAIYCVIVPFLFWVVDKSKPDIYNFAAAVVCIAGIGMVSLTGEFTIGYGDAFTLVGGFLYAVHMVVVAKFCKGKDPIIVTILQLGTAAILSWIAAISMGAFPSQCNIENIEGLIYLAVFATAIAQMFQFIGQKYTNPSAASIILSLESVLGVFFSVIFFGEKLTLQLVIGFILIFIAIVISETKLSFLKRK